MAEEDQGSTPRNRGERPVPPQRPSTSQRGTPPPVQPRSVRIQLPPEMIPIRSTRPRQTPELPLLQIRQPEEVIPSPPILIRQSFRGKAEKRSVSLPPEREARGSSNEASRISLKEDEDKPTGWRKLLHRQKVKNQPTEEQQRHSSPGERPHRSTADRIQTKSKTNRILYTTDEEVRDALVEFGVFIIFLILTSLVTLSIRHSYMFYFNDTMKKLFTTRELSVSQSVTVSFEKLITVPDWWDYLIYNFIVILHGDLTVVNEEVPQSNDLDPPDDDPKDPNVFKARNPALSSNRTHLEGRVFLHENLLLGPPRLRQIRVKKDSCFVNDAFIRYFNTCYAGYSPGVEEIKSEHGGAPFKTMGELDSTPLWTTLNFYRTGGYTIDLSYDKDSNLKLIEQLKKNHWLDRGSRLCLVEFNLYNENTDIFQSAKFIAEIPPTGGVIPQSQLQTVKQYSFITDKSLSMMVVYIFWYIMIVYYNINEVREIRKSGIKNYFKGILNVLDSLILLFCYLALIYNIWHTLKVKSLVTKAKFEETYQSLDVLCLWNTIYVDMMAILAFLVWIKIFKFISFNKTLVQFTTTLKRCSKDLAGFSLMFGIVFLAYAQLGLLLFGSKHPDFRNFVTSVLTMIRMILGDFQYNLIEQANRVLGPIYFLTYILLVFFILLNMFLAIIMETYNTVKSEITQGRSQLGSYVYKKLFALFYFVSHCGRKRQNQDSLPPEPVSREFQDDQEAFTRFEKSKVNLRRNMTPSEAQYFEDVPHDVQNKDMYRLNNRVTLLEEILEQLVTNMDGILKRVEREIKKSK